MRSPFPEFGLFQGAANVGYSDYNSLGMKLTRRYSAGLTVLGAYTFSKSTDNGSGIRTLGTDPLNPQDSYCLSCEDGPSVFDQRHRFVTSVVYDLPFGPGRKYLSEGVLGKVIGGWKVTSVVTIGSGFPLTIGAGEDTANIGNCCRPNRDFNVSTALDDPTIEQVVQHGRVLQGAERHVRHRRPQRGDWSRNHELGLFHVQGFPYQRHRLHPVPFRGVQLPESSELGRPEHDVQQRGVRHDQLDAHRDAPACSLG